MALYCSNKPGATVEYQFPGKKLRRYTTNESPIEVIVEAVLDSEAPGEYESFNKSYPGDVLGSYSFTFVATIPIPANARAYLVSASVNNCGSIGSWASASCDGTGTTRKLEGEPIFLGTSTSFNGTVTNDVRGVCHASARIKWVSNAYRIKVLKDGKVIFKVVGVGQPSLQVVCKEECPKGYLKCSKSGYPGYCCISCAGLTSRVNALARKI